MQSDSLNGIKLSVSFTVNDIQKSLEWYRDIVGFEVQQQHERERKLVAVSFKSNDVAILIARDDGAKGADRVKGAGCSIMITVANDIDALAAGIKSRGGVLDSEPMTMPWGMRAFRLSDPDGFRITISTGR